MLLQKQHSDLDIKKIKLKKKIIPLFILGSIYSTDASGAEKMPEINNSNEPQQG